MYNKHVCTYMHIYISPIPKEKSYLIDKHDSMEQRERKIVFLNADSTQPPMHTELWQLMHLNVILSKDKHCWSTSFSVNSHQLNCWMLNNAH